MNVRIQTYTKDTNEVLLNNFDNLVNICDLLTSKFEAAVKQHN